MLLPVLLSLIAHGKAVNGDCNAADPLVRFRKRYPCTLRVGVKCTRFMVLPLVPIVPTPVNVRPPQHI